MSYLIAKGYAQFKHGDQKYGKEPYIYHLNHVFDTYVDLFGVPNHIIGSAIFLHDVLEDTSTSRLDLKEQGFSDRTIFLVGLLTKEKGIRNRDYIEVLKVDKVATQIKIADSLSNLLHSLKIDNKRLITKYLRNLDLLKEY